MSRKQILNSLVGIFFSVLLTGCETLGDAILTVGKIAAGAAEIIIDQGGGATYIAPQATQNGGLCREGEYSCSLDFDAQTTPFE